MSAPVNDSTKAHNVTLEIIEDCLLH